MIIQLRNELREKLGKKFNLKRFHDTMLYAGNLPFEYMRE
ncbi:MAG TPA: DUF885 family protein, partial [Candidatus Korarchaeota archaeon]|nr:DUF885 family protein [Candidatus Korarchaeota archaeon]